MTRLPLEDRNVWGWPGEKYVPALPCSHPFCEDTMTAEIHHLWPRSFLRNQPSNWVKLPDGRVVGNLVYLCREHHQQITENKERIVWDEQRFLWGQSLVGGEGRSWEPLNPQPASTKNYLPEGSKPLRSSEGTTSGVAVVDAVEGVTEPSETPGVISSDNFGSEPAPGEKCPTCNRRVNHPKKETSPQTSVVKSWRLPAEEKENREQLIEAVAAHLGISTKEKFWMDKLILTLCVLALQGPGHETS